MGTDTGTTSRRWRPLAAALAATALLLAACGGDDDRTERAETSTTTTITASTAPSDDSREGGDDAAAGDDGAVDETTTTTAAPGAGSTEPPAAAVADLTSEQVCQRLPAETVAAALGFQGEVTAEAGTPGGTPQCSYGVSGDDGTVHDITIAALRTESDLEGRRGTEAFRYVIDINTRAAAGQVEQTEVDAGDDAVVLSGSNLHMGIVDHGGRIVTVLLRAEAGGAEHVAALLRETGPLSP